MLRVEIWKFNIKTITRAKNNGIIVFITEMDIPPLEIITDVKINVDSTINLN